MEQQQPISTGNHVARGEYGERVLTQRCIGYQRYNPVGDLALVLESVWSDGVTTYSMMWTDAHGNERMSLEVDRRPRIDVAQTEVVKNAPPIAQARYGGVGSPVSGARRIIVDHCPYCGRTHTHLEVVGIPDSKQRMADCFRGEYVLEFTP